MRKKLKLNKKNERMCIHKNKESDRNISQNKNITKLKK